MASAKRKDTTSEPRSEKKRKSALEEIIEVGAGPRDARSVPATAAMTAACFQMEEKKKRREQPLRTDYWLQPNIVVKVVTKKLGERYHKRKAVVVVTPPLFPFYRVLVRGRWRESRLFLFLPH